VDDPRHLSAEPGATPHLLVVYAIPDCPGWNRARELAAFVQAASIARLEVRVVDLAQAETAVPECVVASPTWVLDDRRIAFGNPEPNWLLARIVALRGGD
jgi:hypothetical protein